MGLTPTEKRIIEFLKNGKANSQGILDKLKSQGLKITMGRTYAVLSNLIGKRLVDSFKDYDNTGVQHTMYVATHEGANQLTNNES